MPSLLLRDHQLKAGREHEAHGLALTLRSSCGSSSIEMVKQPTESYYSVIQYPAQDIPKPRASSSLLLASANTWALSLPLCFHS